jgi:hypothetical protein
MLMVAISCEVDHDVLGYNIPATRFDIYKQKLGWKGVENAPRIREICNSVEDSESNSVRITWLIRSDAQLKIIFDEYAYPLEHFQDLWKELERQGDEIGWHPHLWRWSKQKKCWYEEVSDKIWISHCLRNGYKEFLAINPNLTSIRMGWGFHNNFTMKTIDDLGLKVDLSAASGLKHLGSPDERGSHFLNHYDWSITPEKPYHPSQLDYRRRGKNNEKSLDIIEIPLTTAHKKLTAALISRTLKLAPLSLRRRLLKGSDLQSRNTQHRYIANVTSTNFLHIAKQKFKQAQLNQHTATNLVATFHPIELFQRRKFQVFENNLTKLTELSEKLRVPLRFLNATQMAEEMKDAI